MPRDGDESRAEVELADFGVNAQELVERIWAEVAAEQASRFESSLGSLPNVEPLIHDEERRYINAHCVFDRSPSEVQSAGSMQGLKRRVKHRAGLFVIRVLERHFDQEQEFVSHLVRLQNKITVNHDRVSQEVRDLQEAVRTEVERLWQANAAMNASLQERVAALESELRARLPIERA